MCGCGGLCLCADHIREVRSIAVALKALYLKIDLKLNRVSRIDYTGTAYTAATALSP